MMMFHLLLQFILLLASDASVQAADVAADGRVGETIEVLTTQAFQAQNPAQQKILWQRILELDPHNGKARLQLGLILFSSPMYGDREEGMELLEQSLLDASGHEPLSMPSVPGMRMAMMLGRYRWEVKDFIKAYYYFQLAFRASSTLQTENSAKMCVSASMATMLHPYPNTTEQEDRMYNFYMKSGRQFVEQYKKEKPRFDETELMLVPGAADDPYVHCILTLFQLSFYYQADVAEAAYLHYQVATTLWPKLNYVSPTVNKPEIPPHLNDKKPCTTKKIQLGIASGFLTPGSSVSADFGGVLQRLDRDIFNVTYIQIKENPTVGTDPFVFRHKGQDSFLSFDRGDSTLDGAFVSKWYADIEELNLDVLLYLDLTMNPIANRLAMARLAPVQANSHGHPVTGGIPSVDYFISWGAAELPHEVSNSHYSEELILLDSDVPHQFYKPRNERGVSMMDRQSFADKTQRPFFRQYMPADKKFGSAVFESDTVHWYCNMQKPHKTFPSGDPLLCGVLQQDPDGVLILHKPDTDKILNSFERRLKTAGCDLDRIYWMPALPHHQLLALYSVSTLILDSYPAGGCTTTRETLELSKVVVTLPARLLGGRWSDAYYHILDDDILRQHVVAASPEDYVEKAVRLGRDAALLKEMEERIGTSLHHLYLNWGAVRSWEKALQKLSPVETRAFCMA